MCVWCIICLTSSMHSLSASHSLLSSHSMLSSHSLPSSLTASITLIVITLNVIITITASITHCHHSHCQHHSPAHSLPALITVIITWTGKLTAGRAGKLTEGWGPGEVAGSLWAFVKLGTVHCHVTTSRLTSLTIIAHCLHTGMISLITHLSHTANIAASYDKHNQTISEHTQQTTN